LSVSFGIKLPQQDFHSVYRNKKRFDFHRVLVGSAKIYGKIFFLRLAFGFLPVGINFNSYFVCRADDNFGFFAVFNFDGVGMFFFPLGRILL
jgi:hypothetical protein